MDLRTRVVVNAGGAGAPAAGLTAKGPAARVKALLGRAVCAVAVASACALAAAAPAFASDFSDVGGHWAEEGGYIDFVSGRQIMNGYDDNTFRPDDRITRGEVCQIAFNIMGGEKVYKNPHAHTLYADVSANHWANNAISWATSEAHIMSGDTDANGTVTGFRPDETITREELCAVMSRFADYSTRSDCGTSWDVSSLSGYWDSSEWARGFVSWAANEGIMTGSKSAGLSPHGEVRRGEASKMWSAFCAPERYASYLRMARDPELYMNQAAIYAADDSIGYAVNGRDLNPDVDCSAYVYYSMLNSGYLTVADGMPPYAFWTGVIQDYLLDLGFTQINDGDGINMNSYSPTGLQRGDIVLRPGYHAAIYDGYGHLYEALYDRDGQPGDSSGQEVLWNTYWYSKSKPWTCVLRPPAAGSLY